MENLMKIMKNARFCTNICVRKSNLCKPEMAQPCGFAGIFYTNLKNFFIFIMKKIIKIYKK